MAHDPERRSKICVNAAFDFLKERAPRRLALYGLLALEPVDCCGEAEHAHEG
jgi:hypothetical protein